MTNPNTLLERFRKAVETHDITYEHADDPKAYWRGDEQWSTIIDLKYQLLKTGLPLKEINGIWNDNVRKKIALGSEELYLWGET